MADSIRIKRGVKANLPKALPLGELAYCTDTRQLFIGTGNSIAPVKAEEIHFDDLNERLEGNLQNINELDSRLSNVDNTRDMDKPISTATQKALDKKQNIEDYEKDKLDLNNKIDTLKASQSLEYEGENITCENTLTSRTSSVVVKGQTYQNLITEIYNLKDGNYLDEKGLHLTVNSFDSCAMKTPLVQKGKQYTIAFNFTSPKNNIVYIGGTGANEILQGKRVCVEGYNKFMFVANNTDTTNPTIPLWHDYSEGGFDATISNIMLLEGDWTDKEMPKSITGIESTGEKENKISILSHGKNYYPCKNDCIINLSNAEQNWFSLNGKPGLFGNIESKVDKDLIFFLDKGDYICTWDCDGCYAQLIKMNDTMLTGQSGKQITVDKRTKLTFRLKNTSADITQFSIKNIMIRKVNANSTYEPYKGDKKEILLPIQDGLKSLPNGVADTIEQRDDGVYLVQRVGKVVLNGSENWGFNNTENTKTYRWILGSAIKNNISMESEYNDKRLVSNVPIAPWNETLALGISVSTNKLFFYNNQVTNTEDFKQWLKSNPVTICYQLATPIETKLDINNLDLEVYKDITYVTTDNAIQPVLSFKVPSNLGGALDGNAQNINKLYKDVDKLGSLANENLLANSDFTIWNMGTSFSSNLYFTETANKWMMSTDVQDASILKDTLNTGENVLKMKITENVGNDLAILQTLSYEDVVKLRGKRVTFSTNFKVEDWTSGNVVICVYTGTKRNDIVSETGRIAFHKTINVNQNTGFQTHFLTTDTIQNNVESLTVLIRTTNKTEFNSSILNNGASIQVKNTKLEVGTIATPFIPKSYSEELLACNNGIIGSNPNLLINGDFRINQRRQSSYSDVGFTVDRWCINGKSKVEPTDNGIKVTQLSNGASWDGILQPLEDYKWLNGKTVTLSIKVKNISEDWYFYIQTLSNNNEVGNYGNTIVNKTGITSVVIQLDDTIKDAKKFMVLVENGRQARTPIEIEWVKLELGSVATPFVSRPYGEELALCQRYYQRFYVPQIAIPMDSPFDSRLPLIPDSTHIMRINKPTAIFSTNVYAHDCSSASTTWKLASKGVSVSIPREEDNSLWINRSHLISDEDFRNTYGFPPVGTLVSYNSSEVTSNRISGAVWGWLDAEIY